MTSFPFLSVCTQPLTTLFLFIWKHGGRFNNGRCWPARGACPNPAGGAGLAGIEGARPVTTGGVVLLLLDVLVLLRLEVLVLLLLDGAA
jgi:hypothetical protein